MKMNINWPELWKTLRVAASLFLWGFSICVGFTVASYIFPQQEREQKITIVHEGPGWEGCEDEKNDE